MPCWEVRTITVDFVAANQDVLLRGLKAAGFTVEQGTDGGLIVTKGPAVAVIANGQIQTVVESMVNRIRRAYATEAVRTSAKRYGWIVQQDRAVADRYVVQRR